MSPEEARLHSFMGTIERNKLTPIDRATAKAMGFGEVFDMLPERLKVPDKKREEATTAIFMDRLAQAKIFIEKQPIFYDKNQLWWIWDEGNSYWKMIDDIDILNLVKSHVPYVDIINSKIRNEILNALKQVGRDNVPKYTQEGIVQFKNGVVHYADPEQMLMPNPSYFVTNPIPWEYGASTETPTIDSLFLSWVGEKYVETLYEVTAYCLLSEYPIERVIGLLGGGSNGKSSYLYLLRKFIGMENITSTDLDRLTKSNFEPAKLYKKLVCMMGETNFTELDRTQLIKKAVSGKDPISIEIKGKMPFDAINYAKIIIASNSLPATSDKTDGFYRKWLLIDFPNQFKEGKNPVYSVPDQEFCNLGRKCMVVLKKLMERQSFTNEGDIWERRARYEERSNPFDKFWDEFIEVDLVSNITKYDFKNKLNQWLIERRHRPMSDLTLSQKLEKKGIEETRISMEVNGQTVRPMAWSGVKWRKEVKPNLNTLSVNPVNPVNPVKVQKLHRESTSFCLDIPDTLDSSNNEVKNE